MSETRNAYVNKIKAKLDEWNAEIDKLEIKSRKKELEMRAAYEERISDLKEKRKSAGQELEKLQAAGKDAWEDLKAGVENAAKSLSDAIQSAKSKFK
jgi:hypothetical protein